MIQVGSVFQHEGEKVSVRRFLGKGKGGYSYLVQYGDRQCVLKNLHYEKCEVYTFGADKLEAELRDYETLSALGIPMPRLLAFHKNGQYLLKEYIDGPSLAELMVQQELRLTYFRQMKDICDVLYDHNLNIDYMPQNFIVREGKLYYIDYECNVLSEEWDFEHWGIYFWVNREGMKKFMEAGDYRYISVDGKPVRNSVTEERAAAVLNKVWQGGKRTEDNRST